MTDVLCADPGFGSTWLSNAYLVAGENGDYVVGEAWDDSGVGSPYMPDDYRGEPVPMNFPLSCVLKVEGGPLRSREEAQA